MSAPSWMKKTAIVVLLTVVIIATAAWFALNRYAGTYRMAVIQAEETIATIEITIPRSFLPGLNTYWHPSFSGQTTLVTNIISTDPRHRETVGFLEQATSGDYDLDTTTGKLFYKSSDKLHFTWHIPERSGEYSVGYTKQQFSHGTLQEP